MFHFPITITIEMKNNKTHLNNTITTIVALVICLLLFGLGYLWAKPQKEEIIQADEYAEYENGKVTQILTDNTFLDHDSADSYRGEQMMIVEVTSGQYKGDTLQVYNYVGPIYGEPLKEGDSCTLIISTYSDGKVNATVYEYNRSMPIIIVVCLFFLATALVGGRKGIQSLVGLVITVLSIFFILFPALLKGAPTMITTLIVSSYVALVSLIILGGVTKKTTCAFLGTLSGMILAFLFSLIAQKLIRISGLRMANVEPLLQLRQTGTPLGLRGLLSASVIISSLGAVMDVAMSLSSSLQEVHEANNDLSTKELFKSGMNIGRDMVGTMTNTLILAFIGSGLVLILYIYTLSLSRIQFMSSAYLAIEVVTSISSSIGIILSVPITALIASIFFGRK